MKNNFNVKIYNKRKCETCPTEFIPSNAIHRFCSSCKIKRNEQCKKTAPSYTPENKKSLLLKRNYGISLDEYNEILNKQKGCCKICDKHYSTFKKALAVDHDHSTGKIRGLLCNHCNRGLGYFFDNLKLLENAINYLQ
jgi:hypothetical protein